MIANHFPAVIIRRESAKFPSLFVRLLFYQIKLICQFINQKDIFVRMVLVMICQ